MARHILAVAIAVMLSSLAAPVWAGFDEGVDAYKRADYATHGALDSHMYRAQTSRCATTKSEHGLPQRPMNRGGPSASRI